MFDAQKCFEEISRGDQAAMEFLSVFLAFCHKQDDLIDRDRVVSPTESAAMDLQAIWVFSKNEFFQKHKDFLWPVIITSSMAWVASEDFKQRENILDRVVSQSLKGEYLNVFLAVAFVIGGISHAMDISARYREYHYDDESPKK